MMQGQPLIKKMVQMVAATRSDEIGCDECFEQLDRFAEEVLAGKNAAEAMWAPTPREG